MRFDFWSRSLQGHEELQQSHPVHGEQGLPAANLELPLTSYSGGWKMEIQLCAAQPINRVVSCGRNLLVPRRGLPQVARGLSRVRPAASSPPRTFPSWTRCARSSLSSKYPEKKTYFELSHEMMEFAFPASLRASQSVTS